MFAKLLVGLVAVAGVSLSGVVSDTPTDRAARGGCCAPGAECCDAGGACCSAR